MITSTGLDRSKLLDSYRRNRKRSAARFALVNDEAFYDRPIPLRHPFAFYEGHIPAFSYLTLNERGLQEGPLDPVLERLFERGIDPATVDEARRHERTDWPHRRAVAAFAGACDERVLRALAFSPIEDSTVPRLVRAQSAYTILEHEAMHDETLLYIVHQLDASRKGFVAQDHRDDAPPSSDRRTVGRGIATLGAQPGEIAFGWDNEFGR